MIEFYYVYKISIQYLRKFIYLCQKITIFSQGNKFEIKMFNNNKSLADPESLTEEAIIHQKYQQHCGSLTRQYLRLNARFHPKTKKPIQQKQQMFAVDDDMTIAQIRSRWYKAFQFQSEESKQSQDQWILLYGTQEPEYSPEFPLYDFYTIAQVKRMLGVQKFDKSILIRVYFQWQCPYQKDQAAISYQRYQQKNSKQIQTTFKIIGQQMTKSIYFYIPTLLRTTVKQLKIKLNSFLDKNNQLVKYNSKLGYQLLVKKELQSQTNLVMLCEQMKKYNINNDKNSEYLDFTNLQDLKIRQICSPGQVIYIKLNCPSIAALIDIQNLKYDPIINITCYQRQITKKNKNKKQISNKNHFNKKIITRRYSQIRKLRVSTLLYQQKIQDSLYTSINYKNLTIRPIEKFEMFEKLIFQSKEKQLQFTTLPENLLFYKQIASLDKNKYCKPMDDVLQNLIKNQKVAFSQDHKNQCQKIRQKRKQQVNEDQLRDPLVLDHLVLYTSPYIHDNLNNFLRQSTVSLIKSGNTARESWQYPFCDKLVKGLLNLPNFQGTTYRGSLKFDYAYKQGQIIQWNSFVSTTRQLKTAISFIAQNNNLPYLFQIQSYSGKQMDKFSFYKNQRSVLFMPYTKLEVLKVQKNKQQKIGNKIIQYTYIKMLQIPIPKKIPGNIIVWIDNNFQQNFKTFIKIIKTNKLQNFDIIQLVSNQHFEIWLNQFKHILALPDLKVHFISNMNRPPHFKQQGIQTLQIIRSFSPTAKLVYYIGDIHKSLQFLKNAGKGQDPNIRVINDIISLGKMFVNGFNQ